MERSEWLFKVALPGYSGMGGGRAVAGVSVKVARCSHVGARYTPTRTHIAGAGRCVQTRAADVWRAGPTWLLPCLDPNPTGG